MYSTNIILFYHVILLLLFILYILSIMSCQKYHTISTISITYTNLPSCFYNNIQHHLKNIFIVFSINSLYNICKSVCVYVCFVSMCNYNIFIIIINM